MIVFFLLLFALWAWGGSAGGALALLGVIFLFLYWLASRGYPRGR